MSIERQPSDPEAGPWQLHPRVSLRPEPFGALAYHYDNRKLNFLRSSDLVRLVGELHTYPSPRHAFDALGLERRRWPSYARALDGLAASEFLEPCSRTESPGRTA